MQQAERQIRDLQFLGNLGSATASKQKLQNLDENIGYFRAMRAENLKRI